MDNLIDDLRAYADRLDAEAQTMDGVGLDAPLRAEADLVRRAIQAIETLSNSHFERGFVRAPNHVDVLKSNHFRQAMADLTSRRAYTKGECAMLIAEARYALHNEE